LKSLHKELECNSKIEVPRPVL